MQVHVAVLKEPRGFIKILQFLLAILAFATTVSFSTTFTFHATVRDCRTGLNDVVRVVVDYPFAMDSTLIQQSLCAQPPVPGMFHFPTDVSPKAEFFVVMGVISMLYAMAALVGYILLNDVYMGNRILPTVDLVLHATLAFLWLAAACAWTSGVSTLTEGADPENSLTRLCQLMTNVDCVVAGDDARGGFGKLNASLCFGFLNPFVWAFNLWFVYKESMWFKERPAATPAAATPNPSA